jgi:hypothetical protein
MIFRERSPYGGPSIPPDAKRLCTNTPFFLEKVWNPSKPW